MRSDKWPSGGGTGRFLVADPHQVPGAASHAEGTLRQGQGSLRSSPQTLGSSALARTGSSQVPRSTGLPSGNRMHSPRSAALQASLSDTQGVSWPSSAPRLQTPSANGTPGTYSSMPSHSGNGSRSSTGGVDWASSPWRGDPNSRIDSDQQRREQMVTSGSGLPQGLQGGYPPRHLDGLQPPRGQGAPSSPRHPQAQEPVRRGIVCQGPPPLVANGQGADERWPREVLSHMGMAPQGVGKRPAPSKRARNVATVGLRLVAGACQIPHPNKAEFGGEDSYFISSDGSAVGVADGVGEWEKLGVSTRPLADDLMNGSHLASEKFVEERAGERAYLSLRQGFASISCFGACTANIATLDASGQNVGVANVGDSGLRQIRKASGCSSVVNCTKDQQHFFNCPFQLTRRPYESDYPMLLAQGKTKLVETMRSGVKIIENTPEDADIYTFPLQEGDVLILGSDGLFDNLHDTEICDFVDLAITPLEARQVYAQGAGTLRGPGSSTDPGALATTIAHAAYHRACDTSATTPFSICARSNSIPHSGGKLDDITVICAWVVLTAD